MNSNLQVFNHVDLHKQEKKQCPCPPAPNKDQCHFDYSEQQWIIRKKARYNELSMVLTPFDLNK